MADYLKAEKVCPTCINHEQCLALVIKDSDVVTKCIYFGSLKRLLKEAEKKLGELNEQI
jgi:hypothetical protein